MIADRSRLLGVWLAILLALSGGVGRADDDHSAPIRPPGKASPLTFGQDVGDITFACRKHVSASCSISEFMQYARVCALLVVKAGQIRLQRFNNDPTICREDNSDPDDRAKRYGLASATKSITSTLLGSAIAETKGAKTRAQFEAVMQRPVDHFVPVLSAGLRKADTRERCWNTS
ncbi:hypothetical protein C1D09_003485 [Mesorhizobium intechi]|uniref:hypothetical protein n=1 Tax=Mesorhizobium intechi TaxID=537601 RepID=UPI000CC706F5|nr:hypothetical protein [Mesorhizobium intechi]TSE13549.1 hypothetical protein C1D09_003485 [Mesorhizobium intechi]